MKFAYRFITLAVLGLLIHINSPLDAASLDLGSHRTPPPTVPNTPREGQKTSPDATPVITPDQAIAEEPKIKSTNLPGTREEPIGSVDPQSQPVILVTDKKHGETWQIKTHIVSEEADPFADNTKVRAPKLRITLSSATEAAVPGFNCACEQEFDIQSGAKIDNLESLKKIAGVREFLENSVSQILKAKSDAEKEREKLLAEEARKEKECDYGDDNKAKAICWSNKLKTAKASDKAKIQEELVEALNSLFGDADDEAKFKEARELFKKSNLSGKGKLEVQASMAASLSQIVLNASDEKSLASVQKLVSDTKSLLNSQQKGEIARVLAPKIAGVLAKNFSDRMEREVRQDFDLAMRDLNNSGTDYVARQHALARLGEAEAKLKRFFETQDTKGYNDLNAKLNSIVGHGYSGDVQSAWKNQTNVLYNNYKQLQTSSSSEIAKNYNNLTWIDDAFAVNAGISPNNIQRDSTGAIVNTSTPASFKTNGDYSDFNTRFTGRGNSDFFAGRTLPGLNSPVGNTSYKSIDAWKMGLYGQNGAQNLNQQRDAIPTNGGRGGRNISNNNNGNDIPRI